MNENTAPAPTAYDRLLSGGTRTYAITVDVTEAPGHSAGTWDIECRIREALEAAGLVVNQVEVDTE